MALTMGLLLELKSHSFPWCWGAVLCPVPILGILYPLGGYVKATEAACYMLFTAPAVSLVQVLAVPVLNVVAKSSSENVNTKARWEMKDDAVACGFLI